MCKMRMLILLNVFVFSMSNYSQSITISNTSSMFCLATANIEQVVCEMETTKNYDDIILGIRKIERQIDSCDTLSKSSCRFYSMDRLMDIYLKRDNIGERKTILDSLNRPVTLPENLREKYVNTLYKEIEKLGKEKNEHGYEDLDWIENSSVYSIWLINAFNENLLQCEKYDRFYLLSQNPITYEVNADLIMLHLGGSGDPRAYSFLLQEHKKTANTIYDSYSIAGLAAYSSYAKDTEKIYLTQFMKNLIPNSSKTLYGERPLAALINLSDYSELGQLEEYIEYPNFPHYKYIDRLEKSRNSEYIPILEKYLEKGILKDNSLLDKVTNALSRLRN